MLRKEHLTVEPLMGEVLVYDIMKRRAHCLNRTAARIWQYCDGKTTMKEMANRLQHDLDMPTDEPVINLALQELKKAGLLKPDGAPPKPLLSRREMGSRSAKAVMMLPLVASLTLPSPAAAKSTTKPYERNPQSKDNGKDKAKDKEQKQETKTKIKTSTRLKPRTLRAGTATASVDRNPVLSRSNLASR